MALAGSWAKLESVSYRNNFLFFYETNEKESDATEQIKRNFTRVSNIYIESKTKVNDYL